MLPRASERLGRRCWHRIEMLLLCGGPSAKSTRPSAEPEARETTVPMEPLMCACGLCRDRSWRCLSLPQAVGRSSRPLLHRPLLHLRLEALDEHPRAADELAARGRGAPLPAAVRRPSRAEPRLFTALPFTALLFTALACRAAPLFAPAARRRGSLRSRAAPTPAERWGEMGRDGEIVPRLLVGEVAKRVDRLVGERGEEGVVPVHSSSIPSSSIHT